MKCVIYRCGNQRSSISDLCIDCEARRMLKEMGF